MTPINNYIIVKVDKPEEKTGSLFIPEVAQKKLCKGTVFKVSDKIKDKIFECDTVWYMEDQNPMLKGQMNIDDEHCFVKYDNLNARFSWLIDSRLLATGTKILVKIDKQKQKDNKFFKNTKILLTEFNNDYSFNNQFGEVVSVGPDVEENVSIGDTAFFNPFIEGTIQKPNLSTLIETLPNGDEIRVVQTGTKVDYEFYGYEHNGEFISSKHYVFVEKKQKAGLTERESGIIALEDPNKNNAFITYTVAHRNHNGTLSPGDLILTKQKDCSSLSKHIDIQFIHEIFVEAVL